MSGVAEVLAEGRGLRRSHLPVFAGVMAVHAVAGWALLTMDTVREAVMQAVPVMIATMIEPEPQPDRYVPPPPASAELRVTPEPPLFVLPDAIVATDSQPVETYVAPVVETTRITPPVEAPVRVQPEPPKTIPASAVEYITMPQPAYPLYSRRARETGTVMLRVLISEEGLPTYVEIEKSSGFSRLDEAAMTAMKGARFKPYRENGRALAVWAPAPIVFEL